MILNSSKILVIFALIAKWVGFGFTVVSFFLLYLILSNISCQELTMVIEYNFKGLFWTGTVERFGEGGLWNMKVTCMCLLENKNRALCVGFFEKNRVIGCGMQKILALFFLVWTSQNRVICCKFCQIWVKICHFILKFYVVFLKKEGHLVWTAVKNGVIACKICIKKGVFWQADEIGRHMGAFQLKKYGNQGRPLPIVVLWCSQQDLWYSYDHDLA